MDPFPLPFLDFVIGREMYSFMDGYNAYNQVKIAGKKKDKTTLISKWGIYAYNVMLFGLHNAPATF